MGQAGQTTDRIHTDASTAAEKRYPTNEANMDTQALAALVATAAALITATAVAIAERAVGDWDQRVPR